MTLEEAILATLAAKKKVRAFMLPTLVRLGMMKRKLPEPSERSVRLALGKLVKAGKVDDTDGTLTLHGAPAKKAAPRKKPTPVPRNRVYFFSPHADGLERAQAAMKKRFTVKGDSFRWNKGPEFRLEEVKRADAVKRTRPWQRRWLAKVETASVLCLSFDDLDGVLDEANTLIEAQVLISKVADAPRFLAWNKTLMTTDDEVVPFQPR